MQLPDTLYVQRPDAVNIAYQVVGDGPLNLIVSPGFVSHLDLIWSDPGYARWMRRLSSFARVILFDKPGTGLSDPIPHLPAIEERVDDMRLLLDVVGAEQAAIVGVSEGGPAAAVFAATYPARTRALVIYGSFYSIPLTLRARRTQARRRGFPEPLGRWRPHRRVLRAQRDPVAAAIPRYVRSRGGEPGDGAGGDGGRVQHRRLAALPLIHAPTLVLHRAQDQAIPVELGVAFAAAIDGAKFVELQGVDHVPWAGDTDAIADEIASFVTGSRSAAEPERVLATVLFTDIVKSTERAAGMGDSAWRELLERHEALSRDLVRRFNGRVVKFLGDGMLATFDGPARAVRCAQALIDEVGALHIALRAGVHTGEVEVMGDDLGGMAVHLGARVSAMAPSGTVLVSSTVRDLVVGSDLSLQRRRRA